MRRWDLRHGNDGARHAAAGRARSGALLGVNMTAVHAALIAVALVLAVLVGVPVVANAADANAITGGNAAVDVNITGTVRGENGEKQEQTWENPTSIPDLVPNSNLKVSLSIDFNKGQVDKDHLNWSYALPFACAAVPNIGDNTKEVWDNGVYKGRMGVTCGDDGKAVLNIAFNKTWVEQNTREFHVGYTLNVKYDSSTMPSGKRDTWEFPGVSSNIEVSWSEPDVAGGKNCWYTSDAGLGDGGMKCQITLTAEDDVTDFRFEDSWGEGLSVENNFTISPSVDGLSFAYDETGRKVSASVDKLPKGTYTIEYTAKVNDKAQYNSGSGKYDNARNTATWKWGSDGEHTSSYYPYKIPTGGGSGGNDPYVWVNKSASSSDNKTIDWTVHLNYNGDVNQRADMGGYMFKDELQAGSDGKPAQDYAGTTVHVCNVTTGACTDEPFTAGANGQSFTYTFPQDAGKSEYTLTYQTTPRDGKTRLQNKASVTRPSDGSERGSGSASYDIPVADQNLLSKKNTGEAKQVEGHPGVYTVPWQIDFDPKGMTNITNLNFYEDWTTSDTDGNTLHMWYSKDALGVRVKEYTGGEGCTEDQASCWTDVTGQYQVFSRDGRELPSGYTYPEDYFASGDTWGDSWALHKGSPSFKLWRKGQDSQSFTYDKKLRITYNTLFDGNPDRYRNDAKFSYRIGDTEKGEIVSAKYTHTDGNHVGKTAMADKEGGSDWSNQAIWESTDTIVRSLTDYGWTQADAEAYVKKNCPRGRWRMHWRVWGNGVKSWWMGEGLSGIANLENVGTITMKDYLPTGWQMATDQPVYGRFVGEPNESSGGEDYWETFRLAQNKQDCERWSKGDVTAVCGTWSMTEGERNTATFAVPNDNTLTLWDTAEGDSLNRPYSTVVKDGKVSKVSKQYKSIVVFGFDTYLTPEAAAKTGYQLGDADKVYTNRADILLDGKKIVDTPASGTVKVTSSKSSLLNKYAVNGWLDSNNNLQYKIDVNAGNKQYNFAGNADSFQLVDKLSTPQVEFLRLDKARIDDGGDDSSDVTGQIRTAVATDPETKCQTVTFTVPKVVTRKNGEQLTNPRIVLYYTVHANGLPGSGMVISNTVHAVGSESVDSESKANTWVQQSGSEISAEGALTIQKVDDDINDTTLYDTCMKDQDPNNSTAVAACKVNPAGKPLEGARFEIRTVDIDKPVVDGKVSYTGDAARYVTTGTDGKAYLDAQSQSDANDNASHLYDLKVNTLYAAIEVKSPTGYQVDATPHFFYLASKTNQYALNRMKQFVNSNSITVNSSTTVVVRNSTYTVQWSKADLNKIRTENGKTGVTDGGYLADSAWTISWTDDSGSHKRALADNGSGRNLYLAGEGESVRDEDAADGRMKISGLKRDVTYTLAEATAPDGYKANDATYTFTIGDDGVVWEAKPMNGGEASTDADKRKAGLYTTADGETVIANTKILRRMPVSGSSGGALRAILLGLGIGVVGVMLLRSDGKERRAKAVHAWR